MRPPRPIFIWGLSFWLVSCLSLLAQEIRPQKSPQPSPPSQQQESTDNQAVPPYQPDARPLPERDRGGTLIKTFASLLIVLALIVILAFAFKKLMPGQFTSGPSDRLKLLQNLALGPRRNVVLIEADEKRFLLGVTENHISLLKSMDDMPFDQALQTIGEPRTVEDLLEGEA